MTPTVREHYYFIRHAIRCHRRNPDNLKTDPSYRSARASFSGVALAHYGIRHPQEFGAALRASARP